MKKPILFFVALFLLLCPFLHAQTWNTPINVIDPDLGTGGDLGRHSKLLIVNGNPAMAAYDGTRDNLVFIRATNVSGTAWATPVSVDVNGDVGQYISMQIVNGVPAISYYDATNYDLKYVRATDASGTVWAAPVSVDVTGEVGEYTSLQIVNGNPAISYFDLANGDLKYVRATDASGTTWAAPVTLDATGLVGYYTSMQIVNGNPTIAYHDYTNGDLKYIRATDASGTAWAAPVKVDVTGDVGGFTSLQIVNGYPAIAYHDFTNGDLKYVRATDASGTAWAAPVKVDVTGLVGYYTSMQIVNGNPTISYYDDTNYDLKYVRATDASGTAWAAPVTLDATGLVGYYTSMQIVNGNPTIAYYDYTNSNLKYVRATNASGTAWAAPVSFDVSADGGIWNSLQIVNGNPAISYLETPSWDLKYVRATDASGTAWAAPVSVDVTGDVGGFTSMQIVNGYPAIAYYDYTNGDLKYVRATDASGTAWAAPVSIDVTGTVGVTPSLQIVNGNPAISYLDYSNGYLKYVRATDASGTAWAVPVSIDITGEVGLYTSLQIVNGNPAISYYDITNGDLKYVRATDASGIAWAAPVKVDVTGDVGEYNSLQIVNGVPAIAYYDYTNSNLKYVRATNASGTAWAAPVTLDATGLVGYYTSMQIVNGNPTISYYDLTNGNLKYVRATDANGTAWAAPFALDITGDVGRYTSLQVVNGNPAIAYHDDANYVLKYVSASSDGSINTSLSITSTCAGSAFAINYSSSNLTFNTGNLFTAQLSNATGSFSSPVNIGTYNSVSANGTINVTIPSNTVSGNNYLIRVISSDPVITGNPSNSLSIFNPAIITPVGAVSFCSGNSVLLKANVVAGYKYQWNKSGVNIAGATSSTYSATTSGIYTVAVSNTVGCTAVSPGIIVTVNPFPLATVTAAGTLTFCSGKNVVLKANTGAGYTYQWKKAGVNIAGATLANYTATVSGVYTVLVTNAAGCSTTSTVTTVVVNPVPIASVTAGGPLTFCTGKNVLLKAYAGAGYIYQWKKAGVNIAGATLANYTATVSGVYTVLVTNAVGCSITSAAITVVVNPLPIATVTAGGPLTFCADKNVLLKAYAGAGYIYQWKKAGVNITGATLANYTATVSGVYTVVVTNAVGCSITSAAITVVVNPLPIATVTAGGPLTFCTGKNVLLKAYAVAGYKYQWKKAGVNITGDTLANYTATVSGVYTFVVTNAVGCSITSAAITVVVNPLPIATVTAGGPLTFCTGKNVLLKAYAGAGYKYQWKKAGVNITGDTLANYTATVSGVYTVVVTNAVGCSITSAAITIVVNPLPIATVTAGGPLTFCTGKNVLLKAYAAAGYKYQWKKAGVNITGDTLASYTATVSGVYTVVVTNAVGCSITSAAITVVVNPLPIATVTAGGPLTFCTGKNVLLKAYAGAGYKYQWKKAGVNITGDTLANYTATVSGVYTVVVTNAVGCSITSAAITVVVNPLPIATVTAGGPLTFCTGKNVLLKAYAGAGYKYQWKKAGVNITGDTLANYTATVSGVYTVVVTNAVGCSITSAATTVVVNPLPIATITPGGPLTFPVGGNVLLNASAGVGNTYQWKKDGININGAMAAAYTATTSGTYTVIITNSNLCQATSQAVQVLVNPAAIITKAAPSKRQVEEDQFNHGQFINLYPNPIYRDEYLNIEWTLRNADKGIQVTVFDISGRRIESRFLNSSGKKLKFKGVSGIYMVEIRWGKNERKIFQIIKIK